MTQGRTRSKQPERSSQMLLVQVDGVSGEILGYFMETLMKIGANNVSLVPSLTKKGRPGYLMFIDIPHEAQENVENLLITELGVFGWHMLVSKHLHVKVETSEIELVVSAAGFEFTVTAPVKRFRRKDGSVAVGVEHQFCAGLKEKLQNEYRIEIALHDLKGLIRETITRDKSKILVKIAKQSK